MSELVESLLVLARMDEDAKLEKQTADLAEIAKTAVRDAKVSTANVNFAVTDLDGNPLTGEVFAQVEAASIKQVFTNLIANAGRFSKPGGSVEVALGNTPTHTVIEVRDHGEGIPQALREKVFERFYRADNSRNRETGGSGLGLSIVKTIVNRHKGAIMALETIGGGATFRVELPNY
jgi:two-component system OmpR family sensor kinase